MTRLLCFGALHIMPNGILKNAIHLDGCINVSTSGIDYVISSNIYVIQYYVLDIYRMFCNVIQYRTMYTMYGKEMRLTLCIFQLYKILWTVA